MSEELDAALRLITSCDQTIMREDENRLRHCIRPAGHDHPRWPVPAQRRHTDGDREW